MNSVIGKKQDLKKISDEELLSTYFNDKNVVDEYSGVLKDYKSEIIDRVEKKGKAIAVSDLSGKPKKLELNSTSFNVIYEGRATVTPNNLQAVLLFEEKKFDEDIEISSSIAIRKGVSPKNIPESMVKEMLKYFDIKTEKFVSKESILAKFESKELSEIEMKSCLVEKMSYALKVKEK